MSEQETKKEVLKYIGKELKNKFTKDGVETKIFKLKFDIGMQYPLTIDCFDNLGDKEDSKGLSLKDLEEGEDYFVMYKVKKQAFEAHGKWHDARTVTFINKPNDGVEARKGLDDQQTPSSSSGSSVVIPGIDVLTPFWKHYVDNDGADDVNHAVLCYFANVYEEEFVVVQRFVIEQLAKQKVSSSEGDVDVIPMEDVDLKEE